MKIKFNLLSFILSLVCICFFLLSLYSPDLINFIENLTEVQPLNIVLIFSTITCILGFIGFAECVTWRLLIRSFFTVCVTAGISVFIAFFSVLSFFVG